MAAANPTDPLTAFDAAFASRCLLGALSAHEQRQMVARLAKADSGVRARLAELLSGFTMADADLALELSEALAAGGDSTAVRADLMRKAHERVGDLEPHLRAFTIADLFSLGEASRAMFSWSMAEFLLARADQRNVHLASTSLSLASMVVDVLDVLAQVGQAPALDALLADLRQRIEVRNERFRP